MDTDTLERTVIWSRTDRAADLDDLANVLDEHPTHANTEALAIILAHRLADVETSMANLAAGLADVDGSINDHTRRLTNTATALHNIRRQLDAQEQTTATLRADADRHRRIDH